MSANDTQIGGSHYKGKSFQPWDWDKFGIGTFEMDILHYITREKNGVMDLQKALHYVEKLKEEYTCHDRRNRIPWALRNASMGHAIDDYVAEWGMGFERARAVWLCVCWQSVADLNELSFRISNLIQGKP